MKNLEKLDKFQLENEKLVNVFGGQGGPATSFLQADIQQTAGGQRCDGDLFGNCYVYTYTGDVTSGDGITVYINDKITNTPC